MDLEKYIDMYTNVSREELEQMNATYCDRIDESVFESLVRHLHEYREKEKEIGRVALRTRPLVHVLSVSVQPKNETNDPLSIYGTIYAENCDSGPTEVHQLFKFERDAAETLGTSNKLTLIGPEFSCRPPRTCIPSSWINALLYDGDDNVFAKERFCLDEAEFENDYEEIKCKAIPCGVQGSLLVHYILMPFGVNCRIDVQFYNRRESGNGLVNVKGKITVRYANTDGSCGECVLYEKQGIDFERVEIDQQKPLKLARCWVALPAYSPLVITMDLSDFETNRKIVNKTIELIPQSGLGSGDSFVQEEMNIFTVVEAAWFQPQPFGRSKYSASLLGIPAEDIEVQGCTNLWFR